MTETLTFDGLQQFQGGHVAHDQFFMWPYVVGGMFALVIIVRDNPLVGEICGYVKKVAFLSKIIIEVIIFLFYFVAAHK